MKWSCHAVLRKVFTQTQRRRLPTAAVAVGGWDVSAPTASAETAQRCPASQPAACCRHPKNDQATAAAEGSKHTRQECHEWGENSKAKSELYKNSKSEDIYFLHDFGVIWHRWHITILFHSALPCNDQSVQFTVNYRAKLERILTLME